MSAPAGMKTLVVTADAGRREALAAALRADGQEVHVASDGATALAIAARERPALLIADMELEGLDGLQVLRTALTVLALDLTSVVLLPHTRAAQQHQLLEQGATDVVELPTTPALVLERARAAVDRRRGWSETAAVMHPPEPFDEAARVAELHALNVLDTPPEERFDRLLHNAVERFGVPMATISLVDRDRQWFKSRVGVADQETPREISFCGHAINHPDLFVVQDAALDPRFAENPMVRGDMGLRFYAGCPLKGPGGHTVGMMCILDRRPRALSPQEEAALRELGAQVEAELHASS